MSKEACHLCGASDHELALRDEATLVRCRSCSLVFRSPRPTAAELAHHYEGAYYDDQERFGPERIINARTPVYRHFLERWRRSSLTGRLLDVGAGYGDFVALAVEAGWDATGIEISPVACKRARATHGVEMIEGPLTAEGLPQHHYHRITLWNVLDQMSEPRTELARVRELLAPGGIVSIRVPNVSVHLLAARAYAATPWLWKRLGIADPTIFMTYNFNAVTLRRTLEAAGFTKVVIENSPLTVGDPYASFGRGGAQPLKRLVNGAAGALHRLNPNWFMSPALYAEASSS